MSLDDFILRARILSSMANRAQWICRDVTGFIYVTEDPRYLDNVIMVVKP